MGDGEDIEEIITEGLPGTPPNEESNIPLQADLSNSNRNEAISPENRPGRAENYPFGSRPLVPRRIQRDDTEDLMALMKLSFIQDLKRRDEEREERKHRKDREGRLREEQRREEREQQAHEYKRQERMMEMMMLAKYQPLHRKDNEQHWNLLTIIMSCSGFSEAPHYYLH